MARRKSPAENPLTLREEFRQIVWFMAMLGFSTEAPVKTRKPAIVITYGGGITFNPDLLSTFGKITAFSKKVSIEFDARTNRLVFIFESNEIRNKWFELFKRIKDEPQKFLGTIKNDNEFLRIMRRYSIIQY